MTRYGPVTFWLDTEDDNDKMLIALYESVRERRQNQSQVTRDLLHKGLGHGVVTLEDVKTQLDIMETLLRNGAAVAQSGAGDPVSNPDSEQAIMGKLPDF